MKPHCTTLKGLLFLSKSLKLKATVVLVAVEVLNITQTSLSAMFAETFISVTFSAFSSHILYRQVP